jgi:hypothetical protein
MQSSTLEETVNSPKISSSDKSKWAELIGEWERSEESQKAFCARLGLNLNTFVYWRARFVAASKREAKRNKFIPLAIKNEVAQKPGSEMILENKNGIRLLIPLSISSDKLVQILKMVGFIHA